MNITLDRKPGCEAEMHVEANAEEVREHQNAVTTKYAKLARVPGYRPGKTPAKIIAKRFAKQIKEEVEERLVNEGCKTGIQENDVKALAVRRIEQATFHDDGHFTFTAHLTLEPEIQLPEYKGIEVEAPIVEVTDAMIDERLEGFREQFADFEDIDGPLAMDDVAVVSLKATLDGQPLSEALPEIASRFGGLDDYWLAMEENALIPGLAPKLVDMNIGDTRDDIEVEVPADFREADLQGKTLVYSVSLKGIKKRKLPEINDEFAARLLPDKSLAELRDFLRENMEDDLKQRRQNHIIDRIIAHLDGQISAELPQDAIQRETQRRVDMMVQNASRQGMSNEEMTQRQDEIFAAASAQARRSVKTSFIVDRIAAEEKITVSQNELMAEIQRMAANDRRPIKKVIKEMQERNMIAGIRDRVAFTKTLDFLVENAKITDVPADQLSQGGEPGAS